MAPTTMAADWQQQKIMIMKTALLSGLFALAALSAPAVAQDAVKGIDVFKKCSACHTATDAKNRVGPHLVGIVGRAAGSVEGFKYSKAMAEKGTGGLIWDEANIAAYLKDPKGFIPGNKMAFAGIKGKPEEIEADIANLIAYLKADPKPKKP
jgi:cytochrome c